MNARREMRHHPPAPDKQPITESQTMRSFVSKGITSPVVFKAIGFSRRVQLWNRQASIIMDLTTLALRHGWRCFPISDPCARDSFRSPVARKQSCSARSMTCETWNSSRTACIRSKFATTGKKSSRISSWTDCQTRRAPFASPGNR